MLKRVVHRIKWRLGILKNVSNNTPFRQASDIAEVIETLHITPRGVTINPLFEAHMGRKAYTPLSKTTTKISPNNLNLENAKHADLDRKPATPSNPSRNMARHSEVVRRRGHN